MEKLNRELREDTKNAGLLANRSLDSVVDLIRDASDLIYDQDTNVKPNLNVTNVILKSEK